MIRIKEIVMIMMMTVIGVVQNNAVQLQQYRRA